MMDVKLKLGSGCRQLKLPRLGAELVTKQRITKKTPKQETNRYQKTVVKTQRKTTNLHEG